jgi:hypothetical protein
MAMTGEMISPSSGDSCLAATPTESETATKRGKPMLHRTVLAVAILATAMSYAAKAETDAERQACFNDAQTHCADYIPDRDRVYACLVQKVRQISAPCAKVINASIAANRQQRRN